MTYKEQFVDACRYFHEISSEDCRMQQSSEEIASVIDELQSPEHASMYRKAARFVEVISDFYLKNLTRDEIANKCHVVSSGVNDLYMQTEAGEACPLAITIGTVRYKDELMYETSKEEIAEIWHKGRTREVLNVHVWLTLENMAIIDPSINFTLARRGKIKEKVLNRNPTRVINLGEKTDFEYLPMLVDNQFAHKVDEIGYRAMGAL